MTKWVSAIIGANVVMFLLQITQAGLTQSLWLVPALVPERPWTLVTYMFLHAGYAHIGFNMLALFFFGPRLESLLGGRRFIALYLLSGLGSALLSFMPPYYTTPILGASGAVFGVVAAYARVWPTDRIYIYGVIPVQAWWFIIIMAALSTLGGLGLGQSGVAHFGHLGGIIVGWAYMSFLRRHSGAQRFKQRATASASTPDGAAVQRWGAIPLSALHEINRSEVMRLLDKVRTQGARSLTLEERATLDRFSSA